MFKWIISLFTGEKDNFNVEDVRKINAAHIKGFNKKQEKHKKEVCKYIIDSAKRGERSVYTDEIGDEEWLTEEYILSLKKYFEDNGFDVEMKEYYLKISW